MAKKIVAEFFGTMVLVLFGCGTAAVTGCGIEGGWLLTALAFGLSIIALAYVIGGVSGCHVNPAVSLACAIDKRISWSEFVGYVAGQILGAFAGSGILKLILSATNVFTSPAANSLGSNSTATLGLGISLLVEIILTLVFVYTILGVTADESKSSVAGIVIGLTLTFVHILGIGLTGTSVNPARSLAPAVLSGNMSDVWVFIVGPLVGATLASLMYKFLNKD